MKKILIYITLFIIALGGCKKVDLPAPMIGDPVFSVNATIDNQPINWTAGDNDVYMFTEFSKDNFDIYTLTGRFAKDENCMNDCNEYLSFSIRGNAVTPTASTFNIDEVIMVDSNGYSYANFDSLNTVITNGIKYSFQASLIDSIFGTQADSTYWFISSLGGNNSVNLSGEMVEFSDFGSDSIQVQLDMLTSNGCIAHIEQTIPHSLTNICNFEIGLLGDLMNGFLLGATFNDPTQLATFMWNGSQNNAADSFLLDTSLIGNQSINLNAMNPVCVIDADICLSVVDSLNGIAIENIGIPKIDYTVQPVEDTSYVNVSEQFSKVIIEYQSSDSILYSSQFGINDNSTFTISEIEDFEDNENGERTKKFKVKYECELRSASGNIKNIEGESVIAVAYPSN